MKNLVVETEVQQWAEEVWGNIVQKAGVTSKRVKDTFPYASIDGVYNSEPEDWWTNGFWPGLLWLIYRDTRDQQLREFAESCENKLDKPLQDYEPLHHDVGFMWSLTSVANYKLTGSRLSRRRALTAASHLMGRYNAAGEFFRAWNGEHQRGWAIIDCLMNLGLLYWASEETGDPRFKHAARKHTDTVLREFVRNDGSVHHIVCFDPESGRRVEALGGQGYAPDSAWARGSAWAIYGLAIGASYTGDQRYVEEAERAARFFIEHLPEDQVPPYDFRAPVVEGMGYDTTASACAASGLLEIARLVPAERCDYYYDAAVRILKSLYEHYSAFERADQEAMIVKGTANFPSQHYVNTPIIYGDYFFVEAVAKLKGRTELFW